MFYLQLPANLILFIFHLGFMFNLCQSSELDPSLKKNVEDYFSNYKTMPALKRSVLVSRITNTILRDAIGMPGVYQQRLEWLNDLSNEPDYAEAFFDLAKSLQLRWEARYSSRFTTFLLEDKQLNTEVGTAFGILGLAATLLLDSSYTSVYFKIFRHLFPVLGAYGGKQFHHATQRFGLSLGRSSVPQPPATLLQLSPWPSPLGEDEVDSEFVDRILGLTVTVAFTSMGYEILKVTLKNLRWLEKRGGRVSKNLYLLAGTVLLSLVIETGAMALLENPKDKEILADIEQSKSRISAFHAKLAENGPEHEINIYQECEGITKKAVQLTHLWSREIWEQLSIFQLQLGELTSQFQADDPEFQKRLDDLNSEHTQKIHKLKRKQRGDKKDPEEVLRGLIAFLKSVELNYLQVHIDLLESLLRGQSLLN